METEFTKAPTSELAALIAWGYVLAGNESTLQAQSKSGQEADRLWALVGEKYEAALKIQPDKHEALYNWASALDDQAQTKNGEEADRLWTLAGEKYEAALKIKPDDHEVFNNWGIALDLQAETKSGEEGSFVGVGW